MPKLHLTLACGDYDLTRPLREETVKPESLSTGLLTGSLTGKLANVVKPKAAGTYDTAALQEVPWVGDRSFNELEGSATQLFNFV